MKEFKELYQFGNYLEELKTPAHRISLTKLRLGSHILRIQTGKYENCGVAIPVGERTCLVCKQNPIEDEQHFLMFCDGYNLLRQELFTCISLKGVSFVNLNAHDKIRYLLTADNNNTSKNLSRQRYESYVQKEKRITESAIGWRIF